MLGGGEEGVVCEDDDVLPVGCNDVINDRGSDVDHDVSDDVEDGSGDEDVEGE